ncbi:MAG: hypothetical protein IT363_05640 [Methanoregulaceae archaeon]|nr:hypothetical protein [Methanoregulaceae archaeon]
MRRLPVCLIAALAVTSAFGQKIPTPKDYLGFDVCQDYHLANYRQLVGYWETLAAKSNRITLQSIGKTEEGREQMMAIITDPGNRRNLETYRRASERLARAKDFKDDADARNFAGKQKAVIWIDGGLHANETLVAQHLIETAYRLVTSNDKETKRILKDCIILLVHANPDGHDLVADWYMRKSDPKSRSLANLPVMYQKYAGHDNNRDFYANNLAETRNMNHQLYQRWYPQVVYNHHQSAPAGTIMFVPPFRNPFNYHFDPMIAIGTDLVGTHMHQRMISEGKRGTAMRNSTLYSTWWNGGLRTTTYFHNMIGILTETWGNPAPAPLPHVGRFQIPTTDVPFPVESGRMWHLRDSLEYEISANMAILDYASRYRERLLFDFYRAGRNSIERGQRDNWTRYPSRLEEHGADALKKPELRDARMYVIPRDQPDFPTAMKFIEKLMQCGIEVEELQEDTVLPGGEGQSIPAGSYVVRCDQAFRPHILDMFEPQDHPNDFQYPGGPPIRPYDNAGYTLAYQMGVVFHRVLEPVELKTRSVPEIYQQFHYSGPRDPIYKLNSAANAAALVINSTIKEGGTVTRVGSDYYIQKVGEKAMLAALTKYGSVGRRSQLPEGGTVVSRRPRVALWDRYGGSMESGWTRLVLEQFAFDFEVVYPPDLDRGDLNSKYDCIIFPDGAIPGGASGGGGGQGGQGGGAQSSIADDPTIPFLYRRRAGAITSRTIAELRKFAENGGHLLCIGSSALNAARQFKLPVESALVDENGAALPNTKFFIPGSVLRLKANESPITAGMPEEFDAMFDNSPVFRVTNPDAKVVAFFNSDKPLRSGWAWGQEILKDRAAIVDVPLGKGRVVLYGPEILFRAQPHGTFKLLFNAIFRAAEGK